MNRWLFIFSLGALLTAARAELPIEVPTDTPTNRPGPGIKVPSPLRTDTPTNAVAVPPSAALPASEPYVSGPIHRGAIARIQTPTAGADCLTFTNGDQFAGTFAGFEGGVIRWQSPISKEPIRFRTTGLDEAALAPRAETKAAGTAGWLVFLADGSLWPARQVTVETGHVVPSSPTSARSGWNGSTSPGCGGTARWSRWATHRATRPITGRCRSTCSPT